MGDGADLALEAIWDWDEYMMRQYDDMPEEPPFDGPYTRFQPPKSVINPTTLQQSVVKKNTITCKKCGQSGFVWGKTDAGYWWLKDSEGKFHKCGKSQPK